MGCISLSRRAHDVHDASYCNSESGEDTRAQRGDHYTRFTVSSEKNVISSFQTYLILVFMHMRVHGLA